ncbi:MAG: response regulator [Clostridiales bacterium]|nr:response regulator [Clostridiales bacterium]
MDGFTLCRKIRQRENLPILFITAKVSEADQLRGYQMGADDYVDAVRLARHAGTYRKYILAIVIFGEAVAVFLIIIYL